MQDDSDGSDGDEDFVSSQQAFVVGDVVEVLSTASPSYGMWGEVVELRGKGRDSFAIVVLEDGNTSSFTCDPDSVTLGKVRSHRHLDGCSRFNAASHWRPEGCRTGGDDALLDVQSQYAWWHSAAHLPALALGPSLPDATYDSFVASAEDAGFKAIVAPTEAAQKADEGISVANVRRDLGVVCNICSGVAGIASRAVGCDQLASRVDPGRRFDFAHHAEAKKQLVPSEWEADKWQQHAEAWRRKVRAFMNGRRDLPSETETKLNWNCFNSLTIWRKVGFFGERPMAPVGTVKGYMRLRRVVLKLLDVRVAPAKKKKKKKRSAEAPEPRGVQVVRGEGRVGGGRHGHAPRGGDGSTARQCHAHATSSR